MAKIYTKNKNYSGYTASVKFNQGVGETNDPYLIEWFRAAGFEVVFTEQVEGVDLAKMKKDELIALAEEKGLEVNQKMTKDQIIDLIEAEEAEDLEGDQEEEPEDEEGEKDEEAGE